MYSSNRINVYLLFEMFFFIYFKSQNKSNVYISIKLCIYAFIAFTYIFYRFYFSLFMNSHSQNRNNIWTEKLKIRKRNISIDIVIDLWIVIDKHFMKCYKCISCYTFITNVGVVNETYLRRINMSSSPGAWILSRGSQTVPSVGWKVFVSLQIYEY